MSQHAELARRLTLPLLVFYGIGTILGAGIYVLVGKVAGEAGMYTPFAFVFASLLAAFSAFSYAELSSRYPKSAGEVVYVDEGFSFKPLSIFIGILIVLVGVVSVATLAHGFAGYFNVFFELPDKLVIIGMVLLIGAICAWGIGESVAIAALMTVVEIIGLLIILYVGREAYPLLPQKLPEMLPGFEATAWVGVLLGSFIAFYAFIGFEDIVNVAEEARNPQRDLPLAIIISLVVTTIFYFLISIVAVVLIEPVTLSVSNAPLAMVYEVMTNQSPVVITVISLVSVVNGALIQVIMGSRVLYGMSRKSWLPDWIGEVSPKTRTPLYATLIVIMLILIFALILPLVSLAKITSFITLTIFMLINFALLKIKLDKTPFQGYTVSIWIPVLGGIFTLCFILYLLFIFISG